MQNMHFLKMPKDHFFESEHVCFFFMGLYLEYVMSDIYANNVLMLWFLFFWEMIGIGSMRGRKFKTIQLLHFSETDSTNTSYFHFI